ncbi:MAG: glycosyltransferase 87 family protein [Alicyclobacillus sp.]|nr:glycosyltransferase 87 family protein [Alicyclobacillus sp.]
MQGDSSKRRHIRWRALWLAAALTALFVASLATAYQSSLQVGLGQRLPAPVTAVWMREALPWTVACVCALLVVPAVCRVARSERQAVSILAGMALAVDVWLALQPLSYSMDLLRYLWDGRLLAHGVSPYAYVPADPHLATFRRWPYWRLLAWKDWPEAYPPAAQIIFWLAARVTGGTVMGFKWLVFLNGWVANALFACALRRRRGGWSRQDTERLGWFLLFPPLLVESFGAGHVDAFALPWLLWAWLAALRRRPWQLGAAVAVATGIKLYPVVLFAAFWRRGEPLQAVKSLLAFGVVLAVLCAPFAAPGRGAGLLAFLSHLPQMGYNGSAAYVLQRWLGPSVSQHAVWLVFAAETAAWAAIWWTRANRQPMEAKAAMLGLTFCLASPMFHPWYLVSLLPFAIASLDWAVLWLAFAAHLTYDEVWADMYIEYIPTYALYVRRWAGRG